MNGIFIFLILLACGFFFGRHIEKLHFHSLEQREAELLPPTTSQRYTEISGPEIERAEMVLGTVVVSVDYFKRVWASLINFFGGNLRPYETLLERARREAVLRLAESCPDADEIINLRIETSSISKGMGSSIGCVEVVASGTAVYRNRSISNASV